MLYNLLYQLHNVISFFNVFRYITFRATYAAITAVLISYFFGPSLIRFLKKRGIAQVIRDDGPDTHRMKSGTPTMGGLMIIIATVIPTLLWADLKNPLIILLLFTTLWLGAFGFIDDYLKIKYRNSKGMKAKYKILGQLLLGIAVFAFMYFNHYKIDARWIAGFQKNLHFAVTIPFFKNVFINLGVFYFILVLIIIIGTSNAVNLTDGLDGLAAGSAVLVVGTMAIFAYISGNVKFSTYLQIVYIPKIGEISVFLASLSGAIMGFLWFNTYPAEIFMGDVGALTIGGLIGVTAVLLKTEFLLLIIGGLFVLEALSVIIQVSSFKLTGKRVFRMAPLHHHFELKGWSEPKVVVRFWIIAIMMALIALSTLKLR